MILGGIMTGILEGIGVFVLIVIALSLFIIAMTVKKVGGALTKAITKPFTLVMNIVLFKKKGGK